MARKTMGQDAVATRARPCVEMELLASYVQRDGNLKRRPGTNCSPTGILRQGKLITNE